MPVHRALLLLIAVVLLVPVPAAEGAEPGFTWSPVSRYGGDRPGFGLQDTAGRTLSERNSKVDTIPVRIRPSRAVCAAGSGRWRLDDRHVRVPPPDPANQQPGSCAFTLGLRREGRHRLVTNSRAGRFERVIDVDDRLVVVLGDSVASGEGNPRRPLRGDHPRTQDGVWLERRCHRSAASGYEVAARQLARRHENATSITFVNLACSGATVPEGILGPYGGIEPVPGDPGPLEPQIDRLRRLDRRPGGVDAVVVSVGANDVEFGRIVVLCARPGGCAKGNLGGRPAAEVVPDLIADLDERYAALARALNKIVSDPGDVLLTEYFDPTRDQEGNYCNRSLGFARSADMRWAEQSLLLPLDDAGAMAAREHGWSYVGGIRHAFAKHGYCADSQRWVVRIDDSLLRNAHSPIGPRTKGTMHPNTLGHEAIAARIAPVLAEQLAVARPVADSRPPALAVPAEPDDDDDTVRWVLYVLLGLVVVALFGPTLLELLRLLLRAIGAILSSLVCLIARLLLELAFLIRGVVVSAAVWLWGRLPAGGVKRFLTERWRRTVAFWAAAGRLTRRPGKGLAAWAERLSLLFRPSKRDDPATLTAAEAEAQAEAEGEHEHVPLGKRTWTELVAAVAKVVAAGAGATGMILVLGATILFVRFATVGAPGGQSVNAAGRQEWLVTGWHALILFVAVGALGVLITWGLDRHATAGRPARRGLMVVLALELFVAVWLGDFDTEQAIQLALGFVLATFLFHLLIDHAIPVGRELRSAELSDVPGRAVAWLVGTPTSRHRRLRMAWRVLALVPLAMALVAAATTDRGDRWLFVLPALVLAALMMTAPWGIAEEARKDEIEPIETPRVLLSLTTLLCLGILLGRDEKWLLGATIAAGALAVACMVVAARTNRRFAPYAVAVMLAVPVYGAVLVSLRAIDRPELQPFAAVTTDGRAVCGLYVGRSDGQLWYAELDLNEDVDSNRPVVRLKGRLTSIPDDDETVSRVAPLQLLTDAQVRAVELRNQLLAEQGKGPAGPTCATEAAPPVAETKAQAAHRRLAAATAPELLVAKDDQFPPVSVQTMFALRDRRHQICRRLNGDVCLRITHQGDLPWAGGEGQYLNYPAKPASRAGQRGMVLRTLGSADPERSAATYYLVSGSSGGPISVQHWFYYPFNYQEVDIPGHPKAGYHEGDFESIGMLLSTTRRPRFVWMARHDNEGRVFGFNETELEVDGGHPVVHVAEGSHASYEHCGRQVRPVGYGRVDDDAPCEPRGLLHFSSAATPRIDLSRVGWACWRGRFGQAAETFVERLPQFVNQGPFSPLWQQNFDGVPASPCQGVPDPGGRQGPAEQVNDPGTAARLRRGAGQLVPLIDECSDWQRPALDGVLISACNQDVLDAYIASGLDNPGPARVRIARPDDPRPRSRIPDVPAIQRDHTALRPAQWRITTERATTMTIYASCRQGGRRLLEARFEDVRLQPREAYRIDDRGPEVWRLRTANGAIVMQAAPVARARPVGETVDCSAQPSG